MELSMLWQGAVLGISIAAPVGPIGLLCIQTSLAHGRSAGFATGMGAAAADFCYGLAAAVGLGSIAAIPASATLLRWMGVVMLLWLSCKTFRSRSESTAGPDSRRSLCTAFGTTFLLTAANPLTILSFTVLFGAVAGRVPTLQSGFTLALGVFAGSASWWLILSAMASKLRTTLARRLALINSVSAMILAGFALSIAIA